MVEVFSDFETKQALVDSHTIGFYLPYPVHSLFFNFVLFYVYFKIQFEINMVWSHFGLVTHRCHSTLVFFF